MFGNKQAIGLALLALSVASLAGCSHQKSIGRDELKSDIRTARSFAAESEIFIEFVIQGRSTHRYAEEHSAYLEDEVQQLAKELGQATPEPGIQIPFRECHANVNML